MKTLDMFDHIEIKEYPIQGKMVIGQLIVKDIDMLNMPFDVDVRTHIKNNLLKELVQYMLENKLAEFTVSEDYANGSKLYRVRCFVTPDDQVRLLRQVCDK